MSSPPDPGGPSRVRRTPTAVGPANQSRGSGGSDQIHLDSNLPPAAEDSRGSERGGLPIHMGVLGFRGRMLPNLEEIPRLRLGSGPFPASPRVDGWHQPECRRENRAGKDEPVIRRGQASF